MCDCVYVLSVCVSCVGACLCLYVFMSVCVPTLAAVQTPTPQTSINQ